MPAELGDIGHNDPVTEGTGKRAGPRRAAHRPRRSGRVRWLLLGACLALVVAWVFLVKAAIDFGRSARAGETAGWFFLTLASLGAIACLFAGLLIGVRLLVAMGVISEVPRAAGGRRARR